MPERVEWLPDVPTVAETFPGYEATTWFGLAAPRGLPAETEARLRGAIAVVQADAGLRGRFGALGLIMLPVRDAPAIAATLAGERARWGDIIRARGITLEQ
jgi:tripartite-type tricarboxylate transporter receptor subunit TctC